MDINDLDDTDQDMNHHPIHAGLCDNLEREGMRKQDAIMVAKSLMKVAENDEAGIKRLGTLTLEAFKEQCGNSIKGKFTYKLAWQAVKSWGESCTTPSTAPKKSWTTPYGASSLPTLSIHGQEGMVNNIAFDNAGDRIFCCSENNKIGVWDVTNGSPHHRACTMEGHIEAVLCISPSPRGDFIASGGIEGDILVWDASTLAKLRKLTRQYVSCVKFDANGEYLASGGWDGTIVIHQVNDWSVLTSIKAHMDHVTSLCFMPPPPDPSDPMALPLRLISGGFEGRAKAMEVVEGRLVCAFVDENAIVIYGVVGSKHGVLSCSHSGAVVLWDWKGRVVRQVERAHGGSQVNCMDAFNETLLATGGKDGHVRLWTLPGLQAIAAMNCGLNAVSICFHPTGTRLAAGFSCEATEIKVWDE